MVGDAVVTVLRMCSKLGAKRPNPPCGPLRPAPFEMEPWAVARASAENLLRPAIVSLHLTVPKQRQPFIPTRCRLTLQAQEEKHVRIHQDHIVDGRQCTFSQHRCGRKTIRPLAV